MWPWSKPKPVEPSSMRTYTAQAARQRDGAQAEAVAQTYLVSQGLTSIHANLACTQGEIDLIMLDGKVLVFIEVRWRKSASFGGAAASVTPHKLAKLMRACETFLQHEPKWRDVPCRIDVMALEGDLKAPKIDWLKNVTG